MPPEYISTFCDGNIYNSLYLPTPAPVSGPIPYIYLLPVNLPKAIISVIHEL